MREKAVKSRFIIINGKAMFTFKFELKFWDLLKFQIAYVIFNWVTFILILLVLSPWFYGIFFYSPYPLWYNLLYCGAYLLVAYCLMSIFQAIYYFFKRHYIHLTENLIVLDNNNVHTQTKYATCEFHWNKRFKIVEHFGIVLIFVSNNIAILIPKRAFKNSQQRQEFITFCKEQIANSNLI